MELKSIRSGALIELRDTAYLLTAFGLYFNDVKIIQKART